MDGGLCQSPGRAHVLSHEARQMRSNREESDGSSGKAGGFRRNVSRSKRHDGIASQFLAPPKGGHLHQIELIDSTVFRFLMPYVFPDNLFVSTYRRDEVSPSPEVLTHEVSFPLSVT